MAKVSRKKIPSKKMKSFLKKRADKFDDFKQRKETKKFLETWKSDNLPNPFDVTKQFIQEKGLKIYGGLALHELLSKKKKCVTYLTNNNVKDGIKNQDIISKCLEII